MYVRLSKPNLRWNKTLEKNLKNIFKKGYLTQGSFISQFEYFLGKYLGNFNVVGCSSGTSALHLSLLSLGVSKNDEVILPAYTFPATANVVEQVGAKPVLVDVDERTFNIKIEDIEKSVSEKTKAIIPVHLFGNPCDMEKILEISKKYNLKIIEDAAGALGSKYKNKKCGTFGDIGVFSFHPRKIITTGEGGVAVIKNKKIYEKMKILRNHGIKNKDLIFPGLNYRMNEIQACLGIYGIKRINKIINERKVLAKIYFKYLSGIKEVEIQNIEKNSESTWQSFVIKIKSKNVFPIINSLRQKGIEVTIGTFAIHRLRYYKDKYKFKPSDFPVTNDLYLHNLALPFFNGMVEKDVKKVIEELKLLLK